MSKLMDFDWGAIQKGLVSQQEKKKEYKKDERFYTPDKEKDGTFQGTIRFLPPKTKSGLPVVKVYNHNFDFNGKYINENCPTTIGKECPICKANGELWNSGKQDLARHRKRKITYFSNIIVVKDAKNEKNEGKVFLFRYGEKIHNIIMEAIAPSDKDEKPINVFDYLKGCDFKLNLYVEEVLNKISNKKDVFTQFDKCKFRNSSELFDGNEEKILKVHEQIYELDDFINPSNFKTYEEIDARFQKVLGAAPKIIVNEEKKEEKVIDIQPEKVIDIQLEKVTVKLDKEEIKEKEVEDLDLNIIDDDDDFIKKVREGK